MMMNSIRNSRNEESMALLTIHRSLVLNDRHEMHNQDTSCLCTNNVLLTSTLRYDGDRR